MLPLFLQVVLLETFLLVVHHVSPRNVEPVSVSAVFDSVESKTLRLLFLVYSSNRYLICSPENNSAEYVKSISCASSKPFHHVCRRNGSSVLPGSTL